MAKMLTGATGNTTGTAKARRGDRAVSGVLKYKKTNTGTCTLNLVDGETGAVLVSLSVGASNPDAAAVEVLLPKSYYASITGASGTFSLDAWVDGDE